MNELQFQDWLENFNQSHSYRKPLLMGIVNVTPDSFSDGGKYLQPQQAANHAQKLIAAGADLIDVGGESSRPGATPISIDAELDRVIPVIELIRQHTATCIAIDTTKDEVMRAAINAGANIINDIHALHQPGSLQAAIDLQVPVCLMHMQGTPQTMQNNPHYATNIIDDINNFFHNQIEICLQAGMQKNNLIIDPGFGFGKTPQNNLSIIKNLHKFNAHNLPILLGVSRKSTLGLITKQPIDQRLIAGITLALYTCFQGLAILRTHDVAETMQAMTMLDAIQNST